MKVIVHENRQLEIIGQSSTKNENDVEVLEIQIPEKYQDWNKKIVFLLPIENDNILWDLIEDDNTYTLKTNITKYDKVQFYIWLTHEEQDFRSVTESLYFNNNKDASEEITDEEIGAVNKILEKVDAALEEMDNVDITISKTGQVATVTITRKDGSIEEAEIEDGYTPQKGIDYWTEQDKAEILEDVEQVIGNYINQPFITMEIVNGNLIMEVKEWQE